MSQMSTAPALKCSQCGEFYVLEHLSTSFPDPEGKLLHQLMRDFGNNGMCPNCVERKNYADRMRSSGNKADMILRPGMRDQYAIDLVSFMGGRRGN